MVSFIGRLLARFGGGEAQASTGNSGKLAKDRLQLVLVQDRIDIPAEKMQDMQREIIDVISKYVMVDIDNVDFELSNRERDGLLVAEIPFKPVKLKENHNAPAPDAEDDSEAETDDITDEVADASDGGEAPESITEMAKASVEEQVDETAAELDEGESADTEAPPESTAESDEVDASDADEADEDADDVADEDAEKRP